MMTRERIIRTFAGGLATLGLALGWWVHPYFYLVTAFVGLNLFQSGITGFCGLDLILKRAGVGCSSEAQPST